jgi:hypothetical protein
MTLDELKLINELIENYYDTKYILAMEGQKLCRAREILKREIKLKTLDPVRGNKTDISGNMMDGD